MFALFGIRGWEPLVAAHFHGTSGKGIRTAEVWIERFLGSEEANKTQGKDFNPRPPTLPPPVPGVAEELSISYGWHQSLW